MPDRIEAPPCSLGALLLQQPPPQQPAAAALATMPEVIDLSAWYTQHTALLHQFAHHALRSIANTPARRNTRLVKALERTHADLKQHTRLIASDAVPTLLTRDGSHSIPYERLAVAQAKVQALTAELTQAREELAAAKVEGWRPEFDAMSPRQEELVMQFCQEIAGPRGQPGSPPDPVRLLEMAQALYEAERADCMPSTKEAS